MQEFSNTSKELHCDCVDDNDCFEQVRNNGRCIRNCSLYKNRYKLIPNQIEKLYNKQHNIDENIKKNCFNNYVEINSLAPRIQVLIDAMNSCITYDYRDIIEDLYEGDMHITLNHYDMVNSIVYGSHNSKHIAVNDTVMLMNHRTPKSPNKYITEFKDLLDTFVDKYYEFEEMVYNRIYNLLEN